MLQEQLRFPATQANVEARRALAMAYRTETACHQHLVNAESAAIFEHDNARLKAASRPNRANTSTVSRCTRLISPSFAL